MLWLKPINSILRLLHCQKKNFVHLPQSLASLSFKACGISLVAISQLLFGLVTQTFPETAVYTSNFIQASTFSPTGLPVSAATSDQVSLPTSLIELTGYLPDTFILVQTDGFMLAFSVALGYFSQVPTVYNQVHHLPLVTPSHNICTNFSSLLHYFPHHSLFHEFRPFYFVTLSLSLPHRQLCLRVLHGSTVSLST